MTRIRLGWTLWLAVLAAACGGKAVVDGPASGTGGAGGSTTTPSTGGWTTTMTTGQGAQGASGDPCLDAQDWLDAQNARATACDPYVNMPQCDGTAYVYDYCGCPRLANERVLEAVQVAQQAFNDWVALGCGPWECYECAPFGPGGCIPDPAGDSGHCETITPL